MTKETETQVETQTETQVENTNWLDSIQNQDLKNSKSLSNFKDVEGLANSYVNLEKKLGSHREEIAKELNKTYTADDYKYTLPEELGDDKAVFDKIRVAGIEGNIKPEQLEDLLKTAIESRASLQKEAEQKTIQRSDEIVNALKKEWGDDYQGKVDNVKKLFNSYVNDEADRGFDKLSLGEQLGFVKFVEEITRGVTEKPVGLPQQKNLTFEQANHMLENIRSNPQHKFYKGDPKAVKEVFELQKLISQQQR